MSDRGIFGLDSTTQTMLALPLIVVVLLIGLVVSFIMMPNSE